MTPDLQEINQEAVVESQKEQQDIKEREQLLEMRRDWARTFKWIVWLILAFEILLTLTVGLGALTFKDEWFLRIIITGGFAQIMVMPFTLTKFLFNTDTRKENA
jgi:hypothetical protein